MLSKTRERAWRERCQDARDDEVERVSFGFDERLVWDDETGDGQDLGFNTNSVDEAGDGKASQNAIGYFLDAVTGVVFSALHAADETGVVDSSKNLRVLWARALLDHASARAVVSYKGGETATPPPHPALSR